MVSILSFLYITIILVLGYSVICLVLRNGRLPLSQIIFLTIGLGMGTMGFLLFWASLCGQRPNWIILEIILAGASIMILFSARLGWLVKPLPINLYKSKGSKWAITLQSLALILILSVFITVSWHALGSPLYEWDAFAIWGLKAKVIFYESLLSKPAYFYDVNLSYSHLDYPLGLPFLVSGAYAAIGSVNDQWGKIILPIMTAAFIFMLYDGFRWKIKSVKSLLILAVCVGNGPFIRWAGSGNADLTLTFFYGGSVIFLLKWIENKRSSDLIISALFSAFCAFTKNEGLALAAMNLLILLIHLSIARRKNEFIATAYFFLILVVFILPWIIWSIDIPRTHENYLGRLNINMLVNNSDRLNLIFYHFFQQIFRVERWGGAWLLLIAFSLVGWKAITNPIVRWCWLLLALHIGLYILIFMVTPWNIDDLAKSSLDRLLMHLIPVVGLISCFHWASLQTNGND